VKKVEGPQGGKSSKIIEHLTSSSEEVYLGRLSKEELRRTGFEALWEPSKIWWETVKFADVYVSGKYWYIKYVFNDDTTDAYYFRDKESFEEVLKDILEVTGYAELQ